MLDYRSTVLHLLAEISGETVTNGPVLSTSQFLSEVLRLLAAAANESIQSGPVNYFPEVLRLLEALGGTAPSSGPVLGGPAWRANVLRMLQEIAGEKIEDGPTLSTAQFRSSVLRLLAAVAADDLPGGYRRVLGLTYNNAYYAITGFKMRGGDTLRFSFKCTMASPACNVIGAYDASSAQTNYSLYLGATSSAKYLRYNGSTYNSQAVQNKQYDVVITPTGSSGMEVDSTWTAKTFESAGDLCIGTTSPTATSSKMVGDIIGNVIVDGRLKLIPCERLSDNVLGYYDTHSDTFYEPTGSGIESMGYAD